MRFNTLFQLLALQRDRSPLLESADILLMMPDLFHFFFTGVRGNELTDATTTQMYDPTTKSWAYGLLKTLGLPEQMLGTASAIAPRTGENTAMVSPAAALA